VILKGFGVPPDQARALVNSGGSPQWVTWSDGCWKTDTGEAVGAPNLLSPVVPGARLIFVGRNYPDHAAEMRRADGHQGQVDRPPAPNIFLRTHESLAPFGAPIRMPACSHAFDYEGEIGLVIGKGGAGIPPGSARSHIGGLTLVFDGSVRDLQAHSLTSGKNVDHTGCVGPWVAPLPACDWSDIRVTTQVNGEARQQGHLGELLFSPEALVAHLSSFMALQVGDIISTGTPAGVGAGFDPPKWLSPGDHVEIACDHVGRLPLSIRDKSTAT
jgi:2-keto-4-pentenoate hydratase/2-oxohepta-3-ene-1,7-dioic acid hydratase in catechol pathway